MKYLKYLKGLIPFGFLMMITAIFSVAVMLLWNWLMPVIFGLTVINFWQALGLLLLSRILFGSFRFGRSGIGHYIKNRQVSQKWKEMSDDQRREFMRRRYQYGFGRQHNRDFFDRENCQEHNRNNEQESQDKKPGETD
ncbi:MAG: hypothetical protein LKK21_09465 [Prevotella sp.]|jgi:ABC-type multidrug transport system fused ATPase/permease subunit|nr:hypothetical protein [Prevotella sp.]MCI2088474.1 hypothetical protein [Prevotella sp.]MCI2125858.1 hypothetical protein [Prevotella sp.]